MKKVIILFVLLCFSSSVFSITCPTAVDLNQAIASKGQGVQIATAGLGTWRISPPIWSNQVKVIFVSSEIPSQGKYLFLCTYRTTAVDIKPSDITLSISSRSLSGPSDAKYDNSNYKDRCESNNERSCSFSLF